MKACPHPTCTASIPEGLFACRPHWFLLPKSLQKSIWRAFRSGDWTWHDELSKQADAIWRGEK